MNSHDRHYQTLTAIAADYARIRASLVRTHEDTIAQVEAIARFIELVDRDTLAVFELLRDLEGDSVGVES